jgi:ABC-type histidine transport system ATPase subunit
VATTGTVVADEALAAVASQPPLEFDDPGSDFRAGLVGNVVRCPRLLNQTGHVILAITTQPLPNGVP